MNEARRWLFGLAISAALGACGGDPLDIVSEGDDIASVQSAASVCVGGATRSCAAAGALGACAAGRQTCAGGKWGTCSVRPAAADTCQSGNDDNCNGTPNEGCRCAAGAKRACGTDVGACSKGSQTCSSHGRWGSCVNAVMPKASDTCVAGNDGNCNGIANEGCACIEGAARTCGTNMGTCVAGRETCHSGQWSACVGAVLPKPTDTCAAGNDDNCNGIANENCGCLQGAIRSCGSSSCQGRQTCDASGIWGGCDGGC